MQNTVSLEVAQELHDIGWRKHCNFLVYTSIEQNGNKIVCMEDKFALSAMALGDIKDGGAGLCHHCNRYIILTDTVKEAKAVHNIIQKTSQEWLDHIDEETKQLLKKEEKKK